MNTKVISLRLPADLVEAVDRMAASRAVPRIDIFTELLRKGFAAPTADAAPAPPAAPASPPEAPAAPALLPPNLALLMCEIAARVTLQGKHAGVNLDDLQKIRAAFIKQYIQ